jgi:hypothetical protein
VAEAEGINGVVHNGRQQPPVFHLIGADLTGVGCLDT